MVPIDEVNLVAVTHILHAQHSKLRETSGNPSHSLANGSRNGGAPEWRAVTRCLSYICTLRLHRKLGVYTITGSAVARHCCKAHSKINGKMENSTPCNIVRNPWKFHFETWHMWLRREHSLNKFSCKSLQWGLLHKQVKYNHFVTFPILSFFLSFTRPLRTVRLIFVVYGSNDVVQPKDGLSDLYEIWHSDAVWPSWPFRPLRI